MSLKIGNCTVAYLRVLITDPMIGEPVILQLGAQLGNESFFRWIMPSKKNLIGTTAAENGLRRTTNYLFFLQTVVRTKQPFYVVRDLFIFMKSQKPILLLTYSTQREMELFSEIIRKHKYVFLFDEVIKGVVNTLPIFEKKFPDLYKRGQVNLPMLAERAFRRACRMEYFDTSSYLEVLAELVTTFISPFELIENHKAWREFFPDILIKTPKIQFFGANEENTARTNEDNQFERQTVGGLDPESGGSLMVEHVQQFRQSQNSDEQLLIKQDQSVKYDRFSALEEDIPQKIHQFIEEREALRDNDYPFQRQPEDPNAGIGPFVDGGASFRPLPYWPNPVNPPLVNQNQRGRDWIRDWSQEYHELSGEND